MRRRRLGADVVVVEVGAGLVGLATTVVGGLADMATASVAGATALTVLV